MGTISKKELIQLQELLKLEEKLVEKCTWYSQICEDPELKSKYQQVAAKHQQHVDILLKELT